MAQKMPDNVFTTVNQLRPQLPNIHNQGFQAILKQGHQAVYPNIQGQNYLNDHKSYQDSRNYDLSSYGADTEEPESKKSVYMVEEDNLQKYKPPDTPNYPISHQEGRGIGVIVTNEKFPGVGKDRNGVEKDREYLRKMFTTMELTIVEYNEKTTREILTNLENLARYGFDDSHYLLIVAFSTHGHDRDILYGRDGTSFDLRQDVISLFKPENCVALKGKPKIFLIQACRGEHRDRNINDTNVEDDASIREEVISKESDILIAQASAPSYVAYRTQHEGSWFLCDLCATYLHYGKDRHFVDILTLTNLSLLERSSARIMDKNIAQTSHIESTLRKFLWLEPYASHIGHVSRDSMSITIPDRDSGPNALNPSVDNQDIPETPYVDKMKRKPDTLPSVRQVFDWLPVYDVSGGDYKGLGIIFVNHKIRRLERKGSEMDLENFKHIFRGMELKVEIRENFNLNDIKSIGRLLANYKCLKSFYIAFSTHGEFDSKVMKEKLALNDGTEIEVDFIEEYLKDKCIANKPKVLLIQACRGKWEDAEVNRHTEIDLIPTVSTCESDMLIVSSCVKRFTAKRDTQIGGWFVNSLRVCYDEMKGRASFLQLIVATNNHMLTQFKTMNEYTTIRQPCTFTSTLSGELYI